MSRILRLSSKYRIFSPARKQGALIKGVVVEKETGERIQVKYRKYKTLPRGCSVPRQICIRCRIEVIRKNSPCYEAKICKNCIDLSEIRKRKKKITLTRPKITAT